MNDKNKKTGLITMDDETREKHSEKVSCAKLPKSDKKNERKKETMNALKVNDASPVSENALEKEITDVLSSLWQFKDILIRFKESIKHCSDTSDENMSKKFAEISCRIEAFHEKFRLSKNPLDKLENLKSIDAELIETIDGIKRNAAKEDAFIEIADMTTPIIDMYSDLVEKVSLLESNLQSYFRRGKSDQERKQQAKSQAILPGSSAIIRSQEIERQRIAREIHDGPAQAIANVIFRLDIIQKMINQNPDSIPDEMAKVKEIAQSTLNEIRHFIFDLRPMTLQDLGLIATLKKIIQQDSGKYNTKVELMIEGTERELDPTIDLAIFRIAQESLNNVRKHATATNAWIQLKYLPDKVILIVEDNGAGFDVKNQKGKKESEYNSFGLIGMQERADDINGTLQVTSQPMRGTKVILTVPINDSE